MGRPCCRWVDVLWLLAVGVATSAWCLAAAPRLGATFDEPIYLQRGLERPTADTVGLEELLAVLDHGLFVGPQRREGLVLAQGCHEVRAQPSPFPGGGMGIPDVLAV